MTKEQLEGYVSTKEEIAELKVLLENTKDECTDNDVIMDYRSGYPVPQSVVGTDWKQYDSKKAKREKQIEKLEKECAQIEEFVESIEDSTIRRIFRKYYLEGKTQEQVADEIHIHRSRISKKITDYLKKAHKAQKNTV